MDIKGRYQLVHDFQGEPTTSSKHRSSFEQWLWTGAVVNACVLVLAIVASVYSLWAAKHLDGHDLVVATNAYCNDRLSPP